MILENKILYNINARGQIIEWSINITVESTENHFIVIRSGLFNKSNFNTSKKTQYSKDKVFDVFKSKIKHKIEREGYIHDETKLTNVKKTSDNLYKPMLAQTYNPKKAKFPYFAQPKLNGVRCVAYCDVISNTFILKSRKNIQYNFPNIEKSLKTLLIHNDIDTIVFDGELYLHETSLNVISGEARKSVKTPSLFNLKYVIYDVVNLESTQIDRLHYLIELFADITLDNVKLLSKRLIFNDEQVEKLKNNLIKKKYEGLILRSINGLYKPGVRSSDLLKVKKVLSDEFLIMDIVPQQKDTTQGILICQNNINKELFTCTFKGTVEEKQELLNFKTEFIGQKVTIEYFERTADKQLPFHAIAVAIRNYE